VQYYTVVIQSLSYYDYILTLPDEVLFYPIIILQFFHSCTGQIRLDGEKNVEWVCGPTLCYPYLPNQSSGSSYLWAGSFRVQLFSDSFAEQIHSTSLSDLVILWFAVFSPDFLRLILQHFAVDFLPQFTRHVSPSFREWQTNLTVLDVCKPSPPTAFELSHRTGVTRPRLFHTFRFSWVPFLRK